MHHLIVKVQAPVFAVHWLIYHYFPIMSTAFFCFFIFFGDFLTGEAASHADLCGRQMAGSSLTGR